MADTQDLLGAIQSGDADGVRALLETTPELAGTRDENGVSLLQQALYRGRRDIADLLLAAGHSPDLVEATSLGDADRVREFLFADPSAVDGRSADGFALLHLAAFFGHAAVAQMLLDAGAGVDPVANNPMAVRPLHSAAAGQHAEVVALLLERGADPNTKAAGGYTPLMSAAGNGNVAIINALLAAGADASLAAEDGRTAEMLAEERGHPDVIRRLREGTR